MRLEVSPFPRPSFRRASGNTPTDAPAPSRSHQPRGGSRETPSPRFPKIIQCAEVGSTTSGTEAGANVRLPGIRETRLARRRRSPFSWRGQGCVSVRSEIFGLARSRSLSLGAGGSRRRGEFGSRRLGMRYSEVRGRLWHDGTAFTLLGRLLARAARWESGPRGGAGSRHFLFGRRRALSCRVAL